MAETTIRYYATFMATSKSIYVSGNDFFVFKVTSVSGSIPSGSSNVRMTDISVTLNFQSTTYSEINFGIRKYNTQIYIANNNYVDVDIPYGATSITAPMHNIMDSTPVFDTGYIAELHFWEGSSGTAFILNSTQTTGYFDVKYSYTPPVPTTASTLVLATKPSEFGGTLVYSIEGDSQCTHTLRLKIGSIDDPHGGLRAGRNQTVVIPTSWVSQVPNSGSATITATLYTYYNQSQLGSPSTATFTVAVPSSYVPTLGSLSVAMITSNTVVRNWGLYVQGQSSARLTANNAAGSGGSTISAYYYLDSNGKEITHISTNQYDASLPSYTGQTFNASYQCYVVDSRGRRSAAVSCQTITVYTYTLPTIGASSALRCNAEGKTSEDGTYFKISTLLGFTSINGRNLQDCTYSIQWKSVDDAQYSHTKTGTITGLTDADPSVKMSAVYGGASGSVDYLIPEKSYSIRVAITDKLGNTTTKIIALGTISYTMFFKREGLGVGIGQPTQLDVNTPGFEVNPEWQMIWGFEDGGSTKVRIPGVYVGSSAPTARAGLIWLKPAT